MEKKENEVSNNCFIFIELISGQKGADIFDLVLSH